MIDNSGYTWVKTHKELVEYLAKMEDRQENLIEELKKADINVADDEDPKGVKFSLKEIDPFTFLFHSYKHKTKSLSKLQKLAENLQITIPNDIDGVPLVIGTNVWIFPYKYHRNENEIERLWDFFHKAKEHKITEKDFEDVLSIKGINTPKLTQSLFIIDPEYYLCIDGMTNPYLRNILDINPNFNTFREYQTILEKVRDKEKGKPFYQLSLEAWKYGQKTKSELQASDLEINYWLFNCNPNNYNMIGALQKNMTIAYQINQHKNNIRINDKVIIWLSGKEAGCYAFAKVTSEVKMSEEKSWEKEFSKNQSYDNIMHRADIEIEINLWNRPIPREQVVENPKMKRFTNFQQTNLRCSEEEYNFLKNLASENNPEIEDELYDDDSSNNYAEQKNYPLNQILYGPPGTGKTYRTILLAVNIIESLKGKMINDDHYDDALTLYRKYYGDQIEFITFHQNYSYEDFIQGLRPDLDSLDGLKFKKVDGIFKKLSKKASDNLIDSDKKMTTLSKDNRFLNAIEEFSAEILDSENDEVLFEINNSTYINAIDEDAFRFRWHNAQFHPNGLRMKFSDLLTYYLKDIKTRKDALKFKSELSSLAVINSTYYMIMCDKIRLYIKDEDIIKTSSIEKKNYVLIIDEINRANISRVFGEIITLIEPDKRFGNKLGMEVKLPSGDKFSVPNNLYIIGTMNTADKSIALLDIALRRRFEFKSVYPNYKLEGVKEVEFLRNLNQKIIDTRGYDYQIGHSYFMEENFDFVTVMNNKVIPLLLEYYMNNDKEVKKIVNETLRFVSEGEYQVSNDKYPLEVVKITHD